MTMPEFDWAPLDEWWNSGNEDYEGFKELIERQLDKSYEAGRAAAMAEFEQVGWFKYDKVSRCWHPQYEQYAETIGVVQGWKQLYRLKGEK